MRGHVVKPEGPQPLLRRRRRAPGPDGSDAGMVTDHGQPARTEATLPGILGPLHDGTYVETDQATIKGFLVDDGSRR